MTISMIKLVSGETVLAEVVSDVDGVIKINNPISIVVKVRHAPVLMSHIWMPFDDIDNYYDIRQDHIITHKEVDADMVLYYNKCIDTIYDNMTSTETFLVDGSGESSIDADLESDRLKDLIDKLEAQYHYSANTVLH